jgi:hypothetical protein
MRLFWIFFLLFFTKMNSYSVEKSYSTERLFYCHDPYTGFVQAWTRNEEEITTQILKTQNSDWCGAVFHSAQTKEIPEAVSLKIDKELNNFYENEKNSYWKTSNKKKATQEITNEVLKKNEDLIMSHRELRFKQKEELSLLAAVNLKKLEEQQRQSRFKYLENTFGSKCLRHKANITEYNKCLNDQEQIVKKEKAIQDAKQAEENKRKQIITEKQKAEEERANRLLASMKPEERRSYICEKTYGFRKGSDKFGDCVFKIMAADLEIEKLEMQRKITEVQIEANKKSSTSYDPSVGRAAERAVDIEAARFKREQELETARLAFALSRGLGTPGGINSKIQGTADALNPNQRQTPAQNSNPFPKQTYCKLNPINNRISCYTQ